MAVDLSDVAVATHLVGELGERADSLSADDAIAAHEALAAHLAAVRAALGHVEDQLKVTLEQPRRVGDKTYEVVNQWKWKPDHDVVASNVHSAVSVRVERDPKVDPIDCAVRLMLDLYVAPGDMPKVTVLRKIGLDRSDVARRELAGRKLIVTDRSEDAA